MRRALWADDEANTTCSKCRSPFSYTVFKHHCRKCGLIFCNECSRSKLLIPAEELVLRPPENWLTKVQSSLPSAIVNDEDGFRAPKRVCDGCSHQLRGLQEDLRILVSRANQETIINSSSVIAGVPQIDYFLENEIRNATMMLHNLRTTSGEENIPKELLALAKGVVFMTIIKAGFMFTGRYGTGIVLAKLPDGSWSPPSALALTGMGWGLQIGAELTEVLLILSSDSAVDAFKSRAQISIGAELGVSVGPIGRSLASDISAGNKGAAQAFSYAHSKGLFFGASLEASGIAARPDVNRKFYGQKLSPSVLLSGEYPRPRGAQPLYDALDEILGTRTPSTTDSNSGNYSAHNNMNYNSGNGSGYNGNNNNNNNGSYNSNGNNNGNSNFNTNNRTDYSGTGIGAGRGDYGNGQNNRTDPYQNDNSASGSGSGSGPNSRSYNGPSNGNGDGYSSLRGTNGGNSNNHSNNNSNGGYNGSGGSNMDSNGRGGGVYQGPGPGQGQGQSQGQGSQYKLQPDDYGYREYGAHNEDTIL